MDDNTKSCENCEVIKPGKVIRATADLKACEVCGRLLPQSIALRVYETERPKTVIIVWGREVECPGAIGCGMTGKVWEPVAWADMRKDSPVPEMDFNAMMWGEQCRPIWRTNDLIPFVLHDDSEVR